MKSWHYKILFFVQDPCVRGGSLSIRVKDTSVRVQNPNGRVMDLKGRERMLNVKVVDAYGVQKNNFYTLDCLPLCVTFSDY